MALTKDYRETVLERIQNDDLFALLTLKRALESMFAGEFDLCRSMLRDLVHAKLTFPGLAKKMGKKEPSVYRMLGKDGNPRSDNLVEIIKLVSESLNVDVIGVDVKPTAPKARTKKKRTAARSKKRQTRSTRRSLVRSMA